MYLTKLLLTALCLCAGSLYAQQSKSKSRTNTLLLTGSEKDSVIQNKPVLILGSEYDNRVIFCGRDFGERQFGLSPYLSYYSGKGFYSYGTIDFWSAVPRKPARHVIGLGYEVNPLKNVSVFAGYERWFNHYEDPYFDRAMQNELETGMVYTLKQFSFKPSLYYYFGLERIFQLDFTLSHNHNFLSSGKINFGVISEFTTTLATPVFSYIFYEFPDPDYDYEKLRLVDFDGNLSLLVRWHHLELLGTVHFNFPIAVANESLDSFNYFTTELSYYFEF